jgi:hypothetical protein
MNKKELIEKIEAMPNNTGFIRPKIDKHLVLGLVRQLDEPKKVVVPQFVADWIEVAKKATYNIRGAIEMAPNVKVKDWLELKNVNTFAEAWVNGYTVEKEKWYTVKFKNIQKGTEYLKYDRVVERWYFGLEEYSIERTIYHTRKQLEEAGFGWVFDCEGIEIEEVEE